MPQKYTKDSNSFIERNTAKCILCGLCVRSCREVEQLSVLGLLGRGFKTSVAPAFALPLDQQSVPNCGLCVSLCPTGALTEKSNLKKQVPLAEKYSLETLEIDGKKCDYLVSRYDGKILRAVPRNENARKCADIVKNVGYNYGEKYYDAHHKEHPDWVIYGSETGSVVQSRGIYHFPYQQSVLTDEDEQCSSLGNSTTSWGAKSVESCILSEIEQPYSSGQFVWSGFDFIGEPTPYHTRNSYFGQVDTAGFPKDSYYLYQAAWTDYRKNPMVHIFPVLGFNEGQRIDVRVCSNAPIVELFLTGKVKAFV